MARCGVLSLALSALMAATSPCGAQDLEVAARAYAAADAYRQQNEREILAGYAELLALPNVATNLADIQANAAHIRGLLEPRGFQTRLLGAPGTPPAVFAERATPGAEKTILIYAHYDGQPVQAENWASDPWIATLRSGPVEAGGEVVSVDDVDGPLPENWRLFARSASDDKAPIITLIHALDALKAAGIAPSVNIKLYLDGEEEQGSPHLGDVLAAHGDLLDADLLLFCDGPRHASGRPQLVFGVRGVTGFDLTVYGPTRPLHSGHYGNWAPNPISRLINLMASMRGPDGAVLIPGFTDDVAAPGAAERAALAGMPDLSGKLALDLGIAEPEGAGARLDELIMRPALNFRGIRAGGIGQDARNIILPEATAAIGIRLVPNQTVAGVREAVEAHIRAQGYALIRGLPGAETLRRHPKVARIHWEEGGYPALRTDLDAAAVAPLIAVMRALYGEELLLTPTLGGSLPIYRFAEAIDAPIVILPIANHDNNQHGRNENIRLGNLWNGVAIYAAVLAGY